MAKLTGSAQSTDLGGGYALRAPGLRGDATVRLPVTAATRGAMRRIDGGLAALDAALRSANVEEVRLIDVVLQPDAAAGGVGQLRSVRGEAEIELEVPDLGAEFGQLVLSIDDAGAVRWHLPLADAPASAGATRGPGGTKRFKIPATAAPLPPAATELQQRSIFGAVARRLLKVLVYPITDPVIGAISDAYAAHWEARNRPYRVRSFTPDNYRSGTAPSLVASDLESMRAAGPVLMFIHGTFSTAHGGFGDLPVETLRALHQRYGARVAAFDHPTLADAPDDNVRWLLAQLPQASMEMDIICHSRGGLVARTLAAQPSPFELGDSAVAVRRIVFGGVPNSGTPLADPDHMVDMIDRLTTALTLAPTGPVSETLEALVTVVKMLGHGALKGLQGLASMNPKGPFLQSLNRMVGAYPTYFAIASNYEPTDRGLQALVSGAADDVADQIFRDAGNDLVVPTDGVWQGNGAAGFPLSSGSVLMFKPSDGVMHTDFFRHHEVSENLLDWLS